MSAITWTTPKGNLGAIPASQYYDFQLEAVDSDEQLLFYSFISGELPDGIYVTRDGMLRGVPTVTNTISEVVTYSFTVRATNPNGIVADRSFSLSISTTSGLNIVLDTQLIGAWFDGTAISYQFESFNENITAISSWSIVKGSLPPGISLSTNGLLSGYVGIIAANVNEIGYDISPEDSIIYDSLAKSTDKYFNFTVQAFDGFKFNTVDVLMLIVSKGSYTADNNITFINNTFIRIDADNKYNPIIINAPDSLPLLVSGSKFMYQFIAFDPEGSDVSWKISELAFSGMDELDDASSQTIFGNGSSGPYTLNESPNPTLGVLISYNDILLSPSDYIIAGTQLNFTFITPNASDTIVIKFMSGTTGFDTLVFDQGASGLPAGLTINAQTGWIYGILPSQINDTVTYEFNITAYRTLQPTYVSDPVKFSLTVKRDLNEEIIWITDSNLGIINNGSISELEVSATNTLGKQLEYSIVYNPYRKVPQGLKFLKSGRFTGRTSFRHFSLDGNIGWLNVESTENLTVGMQVQGPSVASGCKITAIVDSNTIEVQPAIYVTQGTSLTFSSLIRIIVTKTVSNAITTVIDKSTTTFDQNCTFTVKASAIDNSITSEKTFTVTVLPYNLAPYENIYLRALPSEDQRVLYDYVLKSPYLFPPNLLYRPDDPLFGLSKTFKLLFLAGLSSSDAETFVASTKFNHYSKTINFGDLKTAIAKDENGNIVYEVVYVEASDTQAFDTNGPPLQIDLNIENGFLSGDSEYKTIYPNSFINMSKRIENTVGFTNRGALPRWMTSVQENGLVLGMTRVVVLAYVKPNAAKLIKYRLSNALRVTTSTNFSFVSDRYQVDNSLSRFYNNKTNSFIPSRATTFDKYTTVYTDGSTVITTIKNTVSQSFTITVPDGVGVGIGWVLNSQDGNSSIPANTYITAIDNNVISLSNKIFATAGAAIKIFSKNQVDYAVSVSYYTINAKTLNHVRNNAYMDGVVNFAKYELLIFAKQQGFPEEPFDGWVKDGNIIPGYLEKSTNPATTTNQRGGVWQIKWNPLPSVSFDDDTVGFDENSVGIVNSYFDQSDDSEIELQFINEILFYQSVTIRSGKTYPNSILQYKTNIGNSIPDYLPVDKTTRTAETTFDGGSCICREKDILAGISGIAGGTQFATNVDKYIVPESLDKYIKFPQTGVFV